MSFAKSVWYVAAWSEEITVGELKPRKLLNEDIVLLRDRDGSARALLDRCPHRFAPLHLGQGTIRCRYHGLEFDSSGRCTRNPHGNGHISSNARVREYPIVERNGIAWVWFGDPVLADPARIPNYDLIDPDHAHVARRYLSVKANYVLETDNILDLSHIQYLHPGTLGSSAVSQGQTQVVQEGSTVWSKRIVQDEQLSPFLERTFAIPAGQKANRWLDVRWDPASSLLLLVSIAPVGVERSANRTIAIPHLFTPETETTTHYWFASAFARRDHPDGQKQAEVHVEGLMTPFATEDMPMLEAQQSRLGTADFWSLNPVLLQTDAAAVRARKVLDELIRSESAAVTQ
jgi:phenylpropionate dioxygenase-like ring-hydroxylating dioxygenase large terminal subunit